MRVDYFYSEEAHKRRERRLLSIVDCLKEKKLTQQELSEEFGVSKRTIQLDLQELRNRGMIK